MDARLRIETIEQLHDGPIQALTAAQLQLEVLAAASDQLPSGARAALDGAAAAVAAASASCRSLLQRLRDAPDP